MYLYLAMDFRYDTKSKSNRRKKTDKLDFIKLKTFVHKKNIIKKVKSQPIECEKIFANHISDRGLTAGPHKELLQLNNKKTTQKLDKDQNHNETSVYTH